MPSNYKYLPATITVDFRMAGGFAERVLLHTKSSAYKAEVSDGHTYNLRHYFHKYRKMYDLDTVCPSDTDLLQFCIVAVGERRGLSLDRILEWCEPFQLEWVGRLDPVMPFVQQKLEEVRETSDRDLQAALIEELMDTVLQQGLSLASRYETFRQVLIAKCKELREAYGSEYAGIWRACTGVLKGLGVLSEEEIAIENWNSLSHKDLIVYIRMEGYPPLKNVLSLDMTPSHHHRILVRYSTRYSIPMTYPLPHAFADVFRNYYLSPEGHCNLYDMLCNWKAEDAYLLDYN